MKHSIEPIRTIGTLTDYAVWNNEKRDFLRDKKGNIILIRSRNPQGEKLIIKRRNKKLTFLII
jgi:hypothetical protein